MTHASLLLAGVAMALLAPAPAAAQPRAPIVQSPELAVLQPPVVVTIEGVRQLVYELHITNLGTTDVALTRIDVLDADRPTPALAELQAEALQAALGRPGVAKLPADPRQLGAGLRAVFYAWLPLGKAAAPTTLRHRIELDVMTPSGRTHRVIEGGRTSVRREAPIVLGPPVQGGRWVAVYGPEVDRGHRRFLYTIDGRARIPARFATDWMKLGDDDRFVSGERTQLAGWHGYAANVLAVADATVAEVHDDVAQDSPITDSPAPITLEAASGNYIALNLGGGRYAFYEHLKPGSVRVKVGARVRRGDVIGLLGNTGSSSSGPHLHFHVSDATASLGAEGLPYVFESFERLGSFQFPATAGGTPTISPPATGTTARRRRELPAPNAVVRF
jgi:murein DD-endopeptidase MepM/ murein hydrolase activator NlpD